MATPIQITDASFEAKVLKCDIPVLIDFWAEWCAPCKIMAPYLDEIAAEYAGRLKINLPTLLLFKFGQPVERIIGVQSKKAILDKVTPYLDE